MEINVSSRFVKSAPDKLRIFSSMLKRKTIDQAINQLENSSQYASNRLVLILKQAKNQIKNKNVSSDIFSLKEIRINEGPKLKRRRLRHQGRATAILKRMSHVTLVLTDNGKSKKSSKKSQELLKNKPKKDDKTSKSIPKSKKPALRAMKGAFNGSKN